MTCGLSTFCKSTIITITLSLCYLSIGLPGLVYIVFFYSMCVFMKFSLVSTLLILGGFSSDLDYTFCISVNFLTC